MKKTTKFNVSFLNKTTTITEYQLRTYSNSSLVELLNKKDFNLGSGHDGMEMNHVDDKFSVLTLEPYVGAPTQRIDFEII